MEWKYVDAAAMLTTLPNPRLSEQLIETPANTLIHNHHRHKHHHQAKCANPWLLPEPPPSPLHLTTDNLSPHLVYNVLHLSKEMSWLLPLDQQLVGVTRPRPLNNDGQVFIRGVLQWECRWVDKVEDKEGWEWEDQAHQDPAVSLPRHRPQMPSLKTPDHFEIPPTRPKSVLKSWTFYNQTTTK